MAKVIVQGDKAYLVDPNSGEPVAIPKEEIGSALAAGYLPASKSEAKHGQQQELYGGTAGEIEAALAGGFRGATLGLGDLLMSGTMGQEKLRALKEMHPTATMGGELAGTIGGGFIPGGPLAGLAGAAGRAGAATTGAAARLLGKSAGGLLPRMAGAAARETVFGAGLGAGQAVSQVALSPADMSDLEMMGQLAKGAGTGAAIGAGFGMLTGAGAAALQKVGSRWSRGTAELKRLRGEQAAIDTELQAMRSAGAAPGAIERTERQLAAVTSAVKEQHVKVAGKIFHKSAGMAIGAALGGGPVGGALGYMLGPTAMKAMKKAMKPLTGKIGGLTERIRSRVTPWAERVGSFLERAEGAMPGTVARGRQKVSGMAREAKDVASRWVGEHAPRPETPLGEAIIETAGHAVGTAAAMAPEKVMTGFMVGGIEGAALAGAAHLAKQSGQDAVARKITSAVQNKLFPGVKAIAFPDLSDDDVDDMIQELQHVDTADLAEAFDMTLPLGTPLTARQMLTEQMTRGLGYLQSVAPPVMDEAIPTGATPGISPQERDSFKQRLQIAMDPEAAMQKFGEGELTRDDADTFRAVYPEASMAVADMLRAEVARVKAEGGKYSEGQAKQIALLTGDTPPQMWDPQKVQMMQAMHAANRQAAQEPPGNRPLSGKVAKGSMTMSQRLMS
jgi:hypothetical protein